MNDLGERDKDGLLTPWALACDALSDTGCDCGEDEPGTCLACRCEAAMRVERARAEKAEAELAELRATLSAPRPAPRCPRCGSELIMVFYSPHSEGEDELEIPDWFPSCEMCGENGSSKRTLDAALDAWRPMP